jgi:hypothetical protein
VHFAHTIYLCVSYDSHNKQTISISSDNRLTLIAEMYVRVFVLVPFTNNTLRESVGSDDEPPLVLAGFPLPVT